MRKKQEILKTAYHLFRKQGYQATGLSEILEKSKAGKSQLYHYYSDKDQLLEEALQFYAARVYDETSRFMFNIEHLDEFEQLIEGVMRLCKSQNAIVGCFIGSVAGEMGGSNEKLRKLLAKMYDDWKALFVAGLERLKDKSLLSKDANTEELAEFFLVTVQGSLVATKINRDMGLIRRALTKSINYIRSYAI
ncbi:MAG: TetR/AcrR family transcriptional regulator [Bdellovibrionales bacterium]